VDDPAGGAGLLQDVGTLLGVAGVEHLHDDVPIEHIVVGAEGPPGAGLA